MNFVFIGAPGTGKGTQAALLAAKKKLVHVSTGDLLRSEIRKSTELGKKVESIVANGGLIDDTTMVELLKVNLNLEEKNYILDGFPRTIQQCKMMDGEIFKKHAYKAIFFDIASSVLVERLEGRRVCKDCGAIYNIKSKMPVKAGICDNCGGSNIYQRQDDNREVIGQRMEVFRRTIDPVLSYYENKSLLARIDASLPQEDVLKSLEALIK